MSSLIPLKISKTRDIYVDFDKKYEISLTNGERFVGVFVVEEKKILILSNYRHWDGRHLLSERNKAYGFAFQWWVGRTDEVINLPGKFINLSEIDHIVGIEKESAPIEAGAVTTAWESREIPVDTNCTEETACCAGPEPKKLVDKYRRLTIR